MNNEFCSKGFLQSQKGPTSHYVFVTYTTFTIKVRLVFSISKRIKCIYNL